MDWHPTCLYLQMLGYWQTLIAGILAVVAGAGTVWATIKSANREVDAANRQVEAANLQVRATQSQIDTMLGLEHRRVAAEMRAFLVALEAAMAAIMRVAAAIGPEVPQPAPQGLGTEDVYRLRQRMLSPLLADLRPAVVRLGSDLAPKLIELDHAIVAFAAAWTQGQSNNGMAFRIGLYYEFHSGLTDINDKASVIAEDARSRIQAIDQELARLTAVTANGISFGALASH